jgi:hypothetical protein
MTAWGEEFRKTLSSPPSFTEEQAKAQEALNQQMAECMLKTNGVAPAGG